MSGIGEKIVQSVAEVMGADIDSIRSRNRKQNLVAARIIAARIIKEHTCLGEQDIAKLLGKDKASVHYYLASFMQRYCYEHNFRAMYEACVDYFNKISGYEILH